MPVPDAAIYGSPDRLGDPYHLREDGLYVPPTAVVHRDEEYDERTFETLSRMQSDHFWYRGRHRFLLDAVRRHLDRTAARPPRTIDLGGGCGGWLAYLLRQGPPVADPSLADSSEVALRFAARNLPEGVSFYQIDLLDLRWRGRWDLAFLLDVLEHIPDDEAALRQVHDALAPGGTLFVTVPALKAFWTWNDEIVHHRRRYRTSDFLRLAEVCGFELIDARYFMFFLSPLLFASRMAAGFSHRRTSEEQKRRLMEEMHRIPHPLVNGMLSSVFGSETPLGHLVPFPWGTSLLAVLRRSP